MIKNQFTKIIATIGPASDSQDMLEKLILKGVDMFRLNLSHGEHKWHAEVIKRIEKANDKLGTHIGIIADLQGPKLRVGDIEGGEMKVNNGDEIIFTTLESPNENNKICLKYNTFPQDVKKGEKVLVDDGKLIFEVVEIVNNLEVKLKVIHGGILKSRKGVNLPNTKISLPSMTTKDHLDLEFLLTQNVNWIALSFVRSAKDIKQLRELIQCKNHPAKIIAKIEKPEAIDRLKSIVKASNAVMVARGDLGIEVPMEKLSGIQKKIIRLCIQRSRPVIVATQMLDSMITNPNPTRAEVTDVANAVLDGTDAVMLSGETSVGDFPELVVSTMAKIISEAEKDYNLLSKPPKPSPSSNTFLSDSICYHTAKIAAETEASAIIGLTSSGFTAFKTSSFRPMCPIHIFSSKEQLLETLNLVWGVQCHFYNDFESTDKTVTDLTTILKNEKILRKGDVVVNMASMPIAQRLRTNTMKLTLVK